MSGWVEDQGRRLAEASRLRKYHRRHCEAVQARLRHLQALKAHIEEEVDHLDQVRRHHQAQGTLAVERIRKLRRGIEG